jgi:hypothetical protein
MNIDVCNGDADGLCAVVQWRLHAPQPACLITGLKRDIALLERVQAVAGDELLVCDVSLRRNRLALLRLLQVGASVRYFDHHAPGDVPVHPLLQAHIDEAGDTCTSLLVDRYLSGRYQAWAVVGAFGDNLTAVADGLATGLGLSLEDRRRLQNLGEAINYNAYGESEQDVLLPPARLYERLVRYPDPLAFLAQEPVAAELASRRQTDLQQAQSLTPHFQNTLVSVYVLPDVPWSRRVSGSLCNALASAQRQRALALLRATADGDYVVSVRAPLSAPQGAAEFCRGFGGDGRAGAAGIDHLPAWQLQPFIAAFAASPWGQPATAPGHS